MDNELKESKDLINSLEDEKTNLQNEINTLTKDMEKSVSTLSDFAHLKESEAELIELKKRLTLALSNAKHLETEYSDLDSQFNASEEEKKSLLDCNAKLTKQLASTKEEVKVFHSEAEKAGKNPWEGEEWEGLTASEIYEIMKHDLVPAQQARLSKLCIGELEKQLEENKSIMMKVLSEKEQLVSVKTKLDAKICFLETSSSESLSESNQSTKNSTLEESKTSTTNKSLIAPSMFSIKKENSNFESFSKEVEKESELKTPANVSNFRRSSRSASRLANISLLKTPQEVKRLANSIEKEEDSEKRMKVKTTDTDSPARAVRVTKKPSLMKPSKLALTEDRDPLGCVTNSPCKVNTPTNKTDTEHKENLASSRGATFQQNTLRGRNKNIQKTRKPEECKQQ